MSASLEPPFQVLLYYLYTPLDDPAAYRQEHWDLCSRLHLRGRILIGKEGINGTVSGPTSATAEYMRVLREDPRTSGVEFKIDPAEDHPFPKLSIKYREEIVTLGLGEEDIDPNDVTGTHLSPAEWKRIREEHPDAIVLDVRNNYESEVGYFEGAIRPDLDNFRDFPEWVRKNLGDAKGKKVLTYCTGGIRCEKFSGFLVNEGFEDVSQLHGGIINYAKDPETQGEGFLGLCYVFDERIVVEANFTDSRTIVSRCQSCGEASHRYRNCAHAPCNRQHFLCEHCEEATQRYCSEECRDADQAAIA
ncbi:MAG: rhodanese-related sulfurtransferase [Verrucomicrobiota bacterium]